jgi:hypothetical protein
MPFWITCFVMAFWTLLNGLILRDIRILRPMPWNDRGFSLPKPGSTTAYWNRHPLVPEPLHGHQAFLPFQGVSLTHPLLLREPSVLDRDAKPIPFHWILRRCCRFHRQTLILIIVAFPAANVERQVPDLVILVTKPIFTLVYLWILAQTNVNRPSTQTYTKCRQWQIAARFLHSILTYWYPDMDSKRYNLHSLF